MEISKITPVLKAYLWGGKKLNEYGKQSTGPIAKSWEFSLHSDGLCRSRGKTLLSLLEQENFRSLGEGIRPENTPIIKFIHAAQPLSVQVHPLPEKGGKNELWIVLEAEPGSFIYCGEKSPETEQETDESVENILCRLRKIPVKKGDTYFITAGTVHAMGQGLTVLEIQQFSNCTYRLFDYGRTDANGRSRPLHWSQAQEAYRDGKQQPVAVPFFRVRKEEIKSSRFLPPQKTFSTITVTEGKGIAGSLALRKGDTLFIPCQTPVMLNGNFEAVFVSPEKETRTGGKQPR